jgi:hypothetical protein
MNSGPGLTGTTRTTRAGGGGPIRIPMEICAPEAGKPIRSVDVSSVVIIRVFILVQLASIGPKVFPRPADCLFNMLGGRSALTYKQVYGEFVKMRKFS